MINILFVVVIRNVSFIEQKTFEYSPFWPNEFTVGPLLLCGTCFGLPDTNVGFILEDFDFEDIANCPFVVICDVETEVSAFIVVIAWLVLLSVDLGDAIFGLTVVGDVTTLGVVDVDDAFWTVVIAFDVPVCNAVVGVLILLVDI